MAVLAGLLTITGLLIAYIVVGILGILNLIICKPTMLPKTGESRVMSLDEIVEEQKGRACYENRSR